MHLWRTTTSTFAMLEHDRSTSSPVVQSTTMSTVFQHRCAHAMLRVHVDPRRRAWCSAAPLQPSFIACAPSRPKCSESAASVASCSSRREAVVAPRWPPFFARQQGRPAPVPPFPEEIAPSCDPRRWHRVPVERRPAKKCSRQRPARSKGGGANRAVCDRVATEVRS